MTPRLREALRGALAAAEADDLAGVLGRCAEATALANMAMMEHTNGTTKETTTEDKLLTPDDALAILGGRVGRRWLLRRTKGMRFRRDLGVKTIRFEEGGLRRWIAAQKP